jgi:hypothetical protein
MTQTNDKREWWQASLNRRDTAKLGAGVAAVAALAGCGDDSKVEDMDTLDAQKKGGWDVGDTGMPLLYQNVTVAKDSTGDANWQQYKAAPRLLEAVKPNNPDRVKEQMPTLIQSLGEKNNVTLASQVKPVSSASTVKSHDQARALAALVKASENPEKTVLVVDVPNAHGPAAAAGMSEFAEPVFLYDNWPHPKGVVKSQDTLGSLIYYAKELEQGKAARKDQAVPTAYILDSSRLNAGKNPGASDFDNRYFVELPSADELKKRGVTNVMYVTMGEASTETDDINDALADYKDGDLKVSNIPLAKFQKDPKHTPDEKDPSRGYYYGGHHHHHTGFYHHYPMFLWIPGPRYGYWGSSINRRMPSTMRPPSYAPTRRPTAFSSRTTGGARGVGRTKPAGFGRVSTRVSKSGRIMGTKTGSVGRYRSSRSFGG